MTMQKMIIAGSRNTPEVKFIDPETGSARIKTITYGTDDIVTTVVCNNSVFAMDYDGTFGIFNFDGAQLVHGSVVMEYIKQRVNVFTGFTERYTRGYSGQSGFGSYILDNNNIWLQPTGNDQTLYATKIDLTDPSNPVFSFYNFDLNTDPGDGGNFLNYYMIDKTGNQVNEFIFSLENSLNTAYTYKFDITTLQFTQLAVGNLFADYNDFESDLMPIGLNNISDGLDYFRADNKSFPIAIVDKTKTYLRNNDSLKNLSDNVIIPWVDIKAWKLPWSFGIYSPGSITAIGLVSNTNYTLTATIRGTQYTVGAGTSWASWYDLMQSITSALTAAVGGALPGVGITTRYGSSTFIYEYEYAPDYVETPILIEVGGALPLQTALATGGVVTYNVASKSITLETIPAATLITGESSPDSFFTAFNVDKSKIYCITNANTENWGGFATDGSAQVIIVEERNTSDKALTNTWRHIAKQQDWDNKNNLSAANYINFLEDYSEGAGVCDETYLHIRTQNGFLRMNLVSGVFERSYVAQHNEEQIAGSFTFSIVEVDKKTITGKVTQDGLNSAGRKVNLISNGEIVDTAITDINGDYSISYFATDTATLVCEAIIPGNESLIRSNLTGV